MKKHLLTWLITMMCLGCFFEVRASVSPTADYVEDFSSGLAGSMTTNPYPQHYWMREGGTKTLAQNTTYDASKTSGKRCIGFSAANNGTTSQVLITPEVGGTVKFYVRRNYTSASTSYKSQLELYIMNADESGEWTRTSLGTADGTSNGITLEGVTAANNITNEKSQSSYQWIPVTLTNVPANTHIGIRMQYLYMDDFSASQVWLEWPAFVKEFKCDPVIDVTDLSNTSLIPMDANGNWKYKTKIQLQTKLSAGTLTADDLKFELQLYFNGKNPDNVKITDLTFSKLPEGDWNTECFETVDVDLDITLPADLCDVSTYFRIVGPSMKTTPGLYRKTTASQGDDVKWSKTGSTWSFKFEAYKPQPQFGYNPSSYSAGTVSIMTFVAGHPWPINTERNEAPIGLINNALEAPAKITKVEFSDAAFALKENLTFPITVSGKEYVWLKPTVVATTPGLYKGTMSVYVEGCDEPYSIELEGAVKPTGKATYKFHNVDGTTGATMPKGWLATGKWTIGNLYTTTQAADTWKESAQTYNMLQTEIPAPWVLSSPKLRFEAGEDVWFDATSNQSGVFEILYSTDRSNWQVIRTLTTAPSTVDETTDLTDCFSGQGGSGYGTEHPFRTFKVTVPQAGEGYIGFRTSDCVSRVDNFVGGQEVAVDFDVAYISNDIPWKAFVNAPADGTITLRNLADDIAAETYDVQVLVDGEVVRTIKGSVALPTGVDVKVPVSAVFLTADDHKVSFKMVKGENTVNTPEITVKVLAENNQEVFQVGPNHSTSYVCDDYHNNFINPRNNYEAKYEAVYTTQLLQNIKPNGASIENGGSLYDASDPDTGLNNGDKIVSLQWPGWVAADNLGRSHASMPMKIYLENTSNNTIPSDFSDVDFMELVFDGQAMVDFTKTGYDRSLENPSNKPIDMTEGVISVVLDKPFEYTGENLRVVVSYPKVYYDESKPEDGAEYCEFNTYYEYNNSYSGATANVLLSKYASGTADDMKSRMVYKGQYSNSTNESVPVMLVGKAIEPATISGKVTNVDGGAAVAGAVVTARNEEGSTYTATADAEGAYTLEIGNTTGVYSVTATAEGFHDFWSADKFNMAEGNKTFNIVMREKAIKISGVVNNEEGPMAGAKVTLKHALSEVSQETTTDAEGKYTFKTELITTDHIIRVEAPYYVAAEKRIGVGDVSVNVDPITLVHMTAKISGTVKGDDGLMADAKVVIKDVKTNVSAETTTDENGAYEFTVKGLDTDYEITVTKQYYQEWTGRQAIGVLDVTVPEIVMTHITAKISGVVKGSDTQAPLQGVKVTATDVKTNVSAETTTDENGAYEFTVKGLDTNYNLTFALAKYDDAATQVAVGVVDATVTDVVMQRKMVNVEATVKGDDGELADAEAVLTLDGESVATAKTLADGKIQLSTPREDGKYVLKVNAYGYEPYEQELTLTEDGNLSLGDIVMTHIVVKVSGEVVNESGEAIDGATVIFTPAIEGEEALTVTTGQDGKFEFETKLIDTEWTLAVEAEGYDKAEQSVSVAAEDIDLGKVTLKKTVGIGAIYADGGISVVPGIGCIEISADGANVIVADTMGRVIRVISDLRGSVTVDGLTAGVYLVNHTKVAVK